MSSILVYLSKLLFRLRYPPNKRYYIGERTVRNLDDSRIIALFNERSQKAIEQLSEKYGKTALSISLNILKNEEDAKECVNDAYLSLWDKIPPENPSPLRAYFFSTVRNQSLKKYRSNTAKGRNSHYDAALDELENVLSTENTVEDEINVKELSRAVNSFLGTLSKENRILFVRRYFYCDSVAEIGKMTGRSPHFVSVRLSRIREKLKEFLRKEDLI